MTVVDNSRNDNGHKMSGADIHPSVINTVKYRYCTSLPLQAREGKISRKELKKLIQHFKIKVSDEQFKELMIVLDPQHTNVISYPMFLRLFETRETKVRNN